MPSVSFTEVFQVFTGSGQHFVTKGIGTYIICILANECSGIVVDSFRDTYNKIRGGLQCLRTCARKVSG